MTLAEKQQRLIEELSFVEDRHERLSLLVDRARRTPPLPPAEKIEANRVPGCVSPAWLVGEVRDQHLYLRADAESPMVKALVAVMVRLYDGALASEAAITEPEFLDKLGLIRDLSPTRRNGLAAVRKRIRQLAESAT